MDRRTTAELEQIIRARLAEQRLDGFIAHVTIKRVDDLGHWGATAELEPGAPDCLEAARQMERILPDLQTRYRLADG